MTTKQYFEFARQTCDEMITLSEKKNHDYTQGSDDPFANFKAVEQLGISAEVGFLTRMMDKMMRLGTYVAKKGELHVQDEGVQDTLKDLANYSILFAGYIKSKQEPQQDAKYLIDKTGRVIDYPAPFEQMDFNGFYVRTLKGNRVIIPYSDSADYPGYMAGQEQCGIKVGDIVHVIRKFPDNYAGWNNSWEDEMDDMVGDTYTVVSVDEFGIAIGNGAYSFPYFALQKEEPNLPF